MTRRSSIIPTRAPLAEPAAGAPALAGALLGQLDSEHPVLGGRSDRERLLAAAWLAGYRSPRTRRAYAGDLAGSSLVPTHGRAG